jgi:hypothetical protein
LGQEGVRRDLRQLARLLGDQTRRFAEDINL